MKDTEKLDQVMITLMEKVPSGDHFGLENEERWSLNARKFIALTTSESPEQLANVSFIFISGMLSFLMILAFIFERRSTKRESNRVGFSGLSLSG